MISTKERLLRAGEKQIERAGHIDLSLREIARSLGLSNMAAYRHFRSKEEYLSTIGDRAFTRFARQLRKARTDSPRKKSAEETRQSDSLARVGLAYFAYAQKHKKLFELMFCGSLPALPTDLESDEGKMSVYNEIREAVSTCLDTSDLNEEERSEELDMYAFFTWTVLHGYCFIDSLWFDPDEEQSKARLEVLLDLSLQTLKSRSPEGHNYGLTS